MSDATRRVLRTVVQNLLGVLAALPLLVDTAGISDAVPGVATALTVSGAVTRLMALPAVEKLLPSWLKAEPPADGSGQ